MKDKSYAIAIVVVLGICCLGMYVAVSGYLNSNPSALVPITPILQATQIAVTLPTDTPQPTVQATAVVKAPTTAPLPSPFGAFQTITASTTLIAPPPLPTIRSSSAASASASSAVAQSCAGFPYCWKYGAPDISLGPTGNECPRNYIWGIVSDASGKGLPNLRVRHQAPNGEVGETITKDKPDVPGKYDVLAPSGTFIVWLTSGGAQVSPQVNVLVQPSATGSSTCLMRIDFFQQK